MWAMTSDAAAAPASEAAPADPAHPIVEAVEAVESALEHKPLLRGWLHLGMFPAVIVAGLALMAFTDSTEARVACGVYILTACLLFGISAVYHRGTWGPRGEAILRRLDHANIFLIIAGTYTPLTVLLLPPSTGRTLLWAVWIAAGAASPSACSGSAPRAGSTRPATSRWGGRPSSSSPTSCGPAASPSSCW